LGLLVAGCGSARVVAAVPARETVSAASCAAVSPARQFADARLVFVGTMLPGPATVIDGRRVLVSPARLRVRRYLKGHGPKTVRVMTAVSLIGNNSTAVAEDGIEPRAGERWKIFATSRRQPFDTSICTGSARVVAPSADGGAFAVAPDRAGG
jgi:hypothetical protein